MDGNASVKIFLCRSHFDGNAVQVSGTFDDRSRDSRLDGLTHPKPCSISSHPLPRMCNPTIFSSGRTVTSLNSVGSFFFSSGGNLADCQRSLHRPAVDEEGIHVIKHGREPGVIDLYVLLAIFLNGFWLRQTDGAHFRMREHHRGYLVIFEMGVLEFGRSKKSVAQLSSSGNSHRGKLGLASG